MNQKIKFPRSEKVYLPGTLFPELRVAMRKVEQVPSTNFVDGEKVLTPNPEVYVYDTSGPFSDPAVEVDLKKGLPRLREPWILKRGDVEQLSEIFLALQEQQAHNINLVTGSHYTPWIVQALELAKPKLHIPVVWNCRGYESMEILHILDGLVDIYLPDLKFYEAETAKAYAGCPDYFAVAAKAIAEMHRQAGTLRWNGALLQRGLICLLYTSPSPRDTR